MDEQMIWGIRIMRGLSVLVETGAFILLLTLSDIRSMIRINGFLGLVGPLIFISVSALGLAAGLGKIAPHKLGLIAVGVLLVVLGTRQ